MGLSKERVRQLLRRGLRSGIGYEPVRLIVVSAGGYGAGYGWRGVAEFQKSPDALSQLAPASSGPLWAALFVPPAMSKTLPACWSVT